MKKYIDNMMNPSPDRNQVFRLVLPYLPSIFNFIKNTTSKPAAIASGV